MPRRYRLVAVISDPPYYQNSETATLYLVYESEATAHGCSMRDLRAIKSIESKSQSNFDIARRIDQLHDHA